MELKRLDHVNFITHDLVKTVDFYCNIIGLTYDKNISLETAKSLHLFIPGQNVAVLHIGDAGNKKKGPKYERFADLDKNNQGKFSTGAFDHFCFALADQYYVPFIDKLEKSNVEYQTYCHDDIALKQIWLLDPNGVRVELNFAD
ncbi:VOC family protein [Piscirickettsia litoralis]|uniref:VOC domain-containing protein n=1 Tax=Piscirickettsia litoralis TaxID=1891921 RepID=A0ABX2ZZL6_9GAMM|nr:VOC family protein [Piscirickettsia litoralis]ODN41670.1 hypothetical protein BGC07_00080 [Piscirickettsia litoralis]